MDVPAIIRPAHDKRQAYRELRGASRGLSIARSLSWAPYPRSTAEEAERARDVAEAERRFVAAVRAAEACGVTPEEAAEYAAECTAEERAEVARALRAMAE